MPEREGDNQELEKLFEKIMKENLVNKIDIQVQEADRVPNKMERKKPTPRHIIMPKVKYKES